jgi:hypothetical protein
MIDIADTWIKFRLGLQLPPLVTYSALMLSWITMSAVAMVVRNRTYHVLFALFFFVLIALWLTHNISNIPEIVSAGP